MWKTSPTSKIPLQQRKVSLWQRMARRLLYCNGLAGMEEVADKQLRRATLETQAEILTKTFDQIGPLSGGPFLFYKNDFKNKL